MNDFEWTQHGKEMLEERNIREEWVLRALRQPDYNNEREDGNVHYVKAIPERGDRILRVVVNPHVFPNRILTVFFDRRLRRKE